MLRKRWVTVNGAVVFELCLIPAASRLGWWRPAAHPAHWSSPEAPVTGKEGTPTSGSTTLELRAQPSTHSWSTEDLFWLGQQNETQTRQLRSSTLPNPTQDLPGVDISDAAVLGQGAGGAPSFVEH